MNLWRKGISGSISLARINSTNNASARTLSRALANTQVFALLIGLSLPLMLGMAGCGTSAAKSTLSQTPLISVAISQAPPTSLIVGSSVQLSATVSNDIANAGVDWVASCGSAPNCGTFLPAHTASGATTIFTAPFSVPKKTTITISALSTTDHGKSSSASLTIISTVTGVTIVQPPRAASPSGSFVNAIATVSGDPANLGVDWKASCTTIDGTVDCTTAGLHTSSGAPVTYIVPGPLQIPDIVGGTVTLTAVATADSSFTASVSFTVTAPITISLTQLPPSSLLVNSSAQIVATLANDTTNAGIDWLVQCDNNPCGTIVPAHTASGVAATYTAPPTVPAPSPNPNPVVTIIATASATAGPGVVTIQTHITIVAPISIKITQQISTGSIVQGRSANLIATVTNDSANAGVDWTVTCGSPGACGSFVPTHSASGAATTFTAPAAVPTGNTVTITATSTTDTTKTDTQTVTITQSPPPNTLLQGQFVMLLTAKNSANGPYALGGVITGDGTGNITGATLDLADGSGNASGGLNLLNAGSYSIGADGRGQIHFQLNTSALSGVFGVGGTGGLNLSVVFVTPQHALLAETDSFGAATGTLDLQNLPSWAGFNGTYSLSLSGAEVSPPNPNYFVASAITITSATSYSYFTDQSDNGAILSKPFTAVSQPFVNTNPDNNGETSASALDLGLPTKFAANFWIIDANHLIVTDWRDSAFGLPPVIVAGRLTAQPASPSVSGLYAFTEVGATAAAQPQAAGGLFTCGSTGTLDVIPLSGTALTNQAITSACSAPVNGRGLITISGASTGGISQFAAYPTADQGLYLIELDGGATGTSGPSSAGIALQQTAATPIASSALSGTYAANFIATTALGSQVSTAQVVSDGVSALTGTEDVNSFNSTAAPPAGVPSFGAALSGSYTTSGNGRFPLSLTITPASGQPTPQVTSQQLACFIVDPNTCLLLSLDPTAPGTGIQLIQNTGL